MDMGDLRVFLYEPHDVILEFELIQKVDLQFFGNLCLIIV